MAKKKEFDFSDASLIDDILRKKYGASYEVGIDSTIDNEPVSTGSIRLDMALRIPFPVGVHELYGANQSGKTTTALHAYKNATEKGWYAMYVDLEQPALDDSSVERVGIDPSTFRRYRPTSGEDACEFVLDIFKHRESAFVVFDSVGSLVSGVDLAKQMDENSMGIEAKLMTKFLKKVGNVIGRNHGRLIIINQIRDNLSSYGGHETTPGGNYIKHAAISRVRFAGGTGKIRAIVEKDGKKEKIVGYMTTATIIKNKRAGGSGVGQSVDIPIYSVGGFYQPLELVQLGSELGVITKNTSWFIYGDEKYHGEAAVLDAMMNNEELFKEIRAKVLDLCE